MKNYQKNSRNPSVPFSCMLEQLIAAVQHKSNKGHLNIHIWSLNLNLVFKPTSFNLVQLHQPKTHSYCHVIACIILCIALIVFSFSVAGICHVSIDVLLTISSMTPMKSYTIFRSARQAKPPCSFQYNPTLSLPLSFIALGQ